MGPTWSRREFSKAALLALGAAGAPRLAAAPAPARRLKIGYTCITWGAFPRGAEASATLDGALDDIGGLGFHGFETFPEILEDWEAQGKLEALLERHGVPLLAGYIRINLTDPAVRKENLAQIIRLARIVKKYGGTFGVLGPGGIKRDAFDFKAARAGIVSTLDDAARAINDVGLGAGLHPHTGTAVETREEVYAVLEGVDTEHMTFAPDVGQLQKGGMDALKVVKDFLPIVRHVHLKDWNGGDAFGGYCPLGQGQVDMAGILDLLEGTDRPMHAMIELDPSKDAPLTPLEAAKVSKAYLQKLGYDFKA